VAIQGLEDIASLEQLETELLQGARFVTYYYTFSVLVMTYRRASDIRYIRPFKSRVAAGLPFTFLSLLVGWWGIPWGPIYTVQSVWVNLRGGKDVTKSVMAVLTDTTTATSTSITDAARGLAK
jgi:hypothetical protein